MNLIKVFDRISSVDQQSTGLDYLRALAKNLTREMNVQYALIGRPTNDVNLKIKTDVAVSGDQVLDNFEYELEGTPCLNVFSGKRVCIHSKDVANLFPDDFLLEQMNVEGYIGAPILNNEGNFIGLVVLLDTKPLEFEEELKTVCEFFAARISGEFFRMEGEERLLSFKTELEEIIEERTAELERLTDQLQNDNEYLEKALDTNKKLMATIFHDISNPLSVASLECERIDKRGITNDKNSKSLLNIEYSLDQVIKIIDHLRVVFTDREQTFEFKSLSIKEITDYSAFIFKDKLESKNLDFNISTSDLRVLVDETTFLNSVFNNFISNAIKFSPKGSSISIDSYESDGRVTIEIQDQGDGIGEDILKQLESESKVTSTLGTDGEIGTGLGLSLVKNYLYQMNGEFKISKNEIGTLVQINLPLG